MQINQMLVVGRDAVEQAKAKVRMGAGNLCHMRLCIAYTDTLTSPHSSWTRGNGSSQKTKLQLRVDALLSR